MSPCQQLNQNFGFQSRPALWNSLAVFISCCLCLLRNRILR